MVRERITLGVLLTGVVLAGILIGGVVPLYREYRAKSKSSEARVNLRQIVDAQAAWFLDQDWMKQAKCGKDQKMMVLPPEAHFLSASPEPPTPTRYRQEGNWEVGPWKQLNFKPEEPVYYSYSVVINGNAENASFTARAFGDLDGDGTTSLFERTGAARWLCTTGEVTTGGGLRTEKDTE